MENEILSQEELEFIIDEMLNILVKENEQSLPENLTTTEKRILINQLILIRAIEPIDEEFYNLQNKLLNHEHSFNITTTPITKSKNNISTIDHDSLLTPCDLYIAFSNHLFPTDLGNNIDNLLILKAGLQLNKDYAEILNNNSKLLNYKEPYITNGYNLPARYIAKLLYNDNLPIEYLDENLNKTLEFIKLNKLKNIVINIKNINENLKNYLKNNVFTIKSVKKLKINIIFSN